MSNTVTTERPVDDGITRAPNDLDYDPTDIDALGDMIQTDEHGCREQITFEARPCQYIEFVFDPQMGGAAKARLTISEARTLAASLVKAADNLEAGRGTV